MTAAIPVDVTDLLSDLHRQLARLEQDQSDLRTGTGRWADTPVGRGYQTLDDARRRHYDDVQRAGDPHLGLLARRRARHAEQASTAAVARATTAWAQTIEPLASELSQQGHQLAREASELEAAQQSRATFLEANPGITARITELEHAIALEPPDVRRAAVRSRPASLRPQPRHDPHFQHLHAQHAQAPNSPQIHGPSI